MRGMPIDNFGEVADNILQFDNDGEFYLVHVLRRRKDSKGKPPEGVNEDNSLIKHYFVYDKEYLEKKKDAIIALCNQNNARAYILPQRRACRLVLWALHNKVSDTLKGGAMHVHFDHLIRTCIAGMHETEKRWHKRWIIDIDEDDRETFRMASLWRDIHFSPLSDNFLIEHYASWMAHKIRSCLVASMRYGDQELFMPKVGHSYSENDVTLLRTPHGFHIVTPPFNRELKAMEKYFGIGYPKSEWIKPDALALLYAPASI